MSFAKKSWIKKLKLLTYICTLSFITPSFAQEPENPAPTEEQMDASKTNDADTPKDDIPQPPDDLNKTAPSDEPKAEPIKTSVKSDTASTNDEAEKKTSSRYFEKYLGPVRVGPTVGFGILQGPNVGLEAKIWDRIGLSFTFGGYRDLNVTSLVSKASNDNFNVTSFMLSYQQIEGKVSFYPFAGAFFVGLAFGDRLINAKGSADIKPGTTGLSDIPVDLEYQINSFYITPQIGWFWTLWDTNLGSLMLGTEIGAQIALSTSSVFNAEVSGSNTSGINNVIQQWDTYKDLKKTLYTTVDDAVKKYPMPYWNIIKLGWLF